MQDPIETIVLYVAFVFSATCHEASHAWAAKRGGDLTAYAAGQVSLDPFPHIRREPFGMVILPLIGLFLIGWPLGFASAPYDPHWALLQLKVTKQLPSLFPVSVTSMLASGYTPNQSLSISKVPHQAAEMSQVPTKAHCPGAVPVFPPAVPPAVRPGPVSVGPS